MNSPHQRISTSFAGACLLVFSLPCFADKPLSPPPSVDDFLMTGEFTLARDAAESNEDSDDRDHALAKIAAKQQAVGAVQASIETMSGIANDAIRAQVDFRQIGGGGGGFGGGQQGGGGQLGIGGGGGGGGQGGQSGQAQADFETLIELITTTVDPDTWEEVGGQGTIAGFPGGVYVDSKGVLKHVASDTAATTVVLGRASAIHVRDDDHVSISLPRLEKALQLQRARGLPPSLELQTLGMLGQVESIHIFPETGDIVIAGPRAPSIDSALRLDDLAVIMRTVFNSDGKFGCSINPRRDNLRRTQEFLSSTSQRALKVGERPAWLQQMTLLMGRQDVEVFGIPAETSTAQVLVCADYHMKRIGMGLEEGTTELRDYFECMEDFTDNLPSMDVLRWWFTSNFEGVAVNEDQTVYKLLGDAVRVLSENELLDATGKRIHTGESHPVNKQFAAEFTQQFDSLAERYPIYARLRGIFELAVTAALLVEDDLPARVGWQPTMLVQDNGYLVPHVQPATEVDSIVGHRVFHRTQIMAGVSGGVSFDPRRVIKQRRRLQEPPTAGSLSELAKPTEKRGPEEHWHW